MAQVYNPIVRTFRQFRAALSRATGIARHQIRPATPLEDLLPVRRRREIWRGLRREGVRVPALELPQVAGAIVGWSVPLGAAALALWSGEWAALLSVFPFGLRAYWASRPWAVEFPLGMQTAGELAIYLTCFRDHRNSGYRWTHNEITTKVRMIMAECLGLRLDQVRPESTCVELGIE
jgi:hypothetical protein